MFEKPLSFVSKVTAGISAVIIMAMVFLTVADVFLRYLFRHPIIWNFDVQTLLIVPVVFLGLSYVEAQRGHIKIDIMSSHLSGSDKLWQSLFSEAIFFFFTGFITWRMSLQAWDALLIGDYLDGIVRVPIWWAKGTLAVGTGILTLYLALRISQDLGGLLKSGKAKAARWYAGLAVIILICVFLVVATIWLKSINAQPTTIGLVSVVTLLVLLLAGLPIAPASGAIAIWGIFMLSGTKAALGVAGSQPFQFILSYLMTVVPLFVAMGILAGLAGFATQAYEAARRWLQGIPGGLVHATIAGAAVFSAASGTSTAACAAFSKLVLPEMIKHGVQKSLALGAVACAATMDIMIPPSVTLVTYALLTQQSVGKLLIAGIIPGLLQAVLYMVLVLVRCKLDPSLTPKGASFTWKERFSSILPAWGLLFIVFVVMGGIYSGVFTPIEAGAIGTFAAFIGILVTRKVKISEIKEALFSTVSLSSSVLFIIVGGMMFGVVLAQSRLPVVLSEYIGGLNTSPLVILIAIMVFYIIVGCFMDALSILIITLPIVFPLIMKLGYDPIWFGILITITVEVALVSPPYGLNLFVMQATVPDLKLGELYRGVSWFIVMDLVFMVLLIAFPEIALWLPGMMMG